MNAHAKTIEADAVGVDELESMFTSAEDATWQAREYSERDRDYANGKQLTAKQIEAMEEAGIPVVTTNKIRRKVEWLNGLEIKQRTDPKAYPRTPEHDEEAEAATDAIRFVVDNNDFDQVKSAVYDEMLVEGFGGVEVLHKMTPKGVEITIEQTPWDRIFYDPHSRKHDFTDANYLGTVIWNDVENLKLKHGEQAEAIQAAVLNSATDTYDDRPKYNYWYDGKRKRAKVILLWHRVKGEWHWAKFVKGIILEDGVSPYRDEDGESVCPLILQSAYVDRNNQRYGIVRDMIDMQDEINKRRSKALQHFMTRQLLMTEGLAATSVADLKAEMKKPDGILQIQTTAPEDRFEIVSGNDLASGQVALYEDAKNEIDEIGVSGEMTDGGQPGQSGRAIMAKQQAGMIGVTLLTDRLSHFSKRVYEQIWLRVKQYWNEERWIRVTDDDRKSRFVQLNRPVTLFEALGKMEEHQAVQASRQMGLTVNDQRLEMVVGTANEVSRIDVDILIEESPDMISLDGEMFDALLKYGPVIPPKVLIEADPSMPMKKKEKLLKLMEEEQAAMMQQQGPMQQLEMADKEAETFKKQADGQKSLAQAQSMQIP